MAFQSAASLVDLLARSSAASLVDLLASSSAAEMALQSAAEMALQSAASLVVLWVWQLEEPKGRPTAMCSGESMGLRMGSCLAETTDS